VVAAVAIRVVVEILIVEVLLVEIANIVGVVPVVDVGAFRLSRISGVRDQTPGPTDTHHWRRKCAAPSGTYRCGVLMRRAPRAATPRAAAARRRPPPRIPRRATGH